MEVTGLKIAGALFERSPQVNNESLKGILFKTFEMMHWYKNNTKKGKIPITIVKQVFVFLATISIAKGED